MPTRVPLTLSEFQRATPVIINVADLSAKVNRLRAPVFLHFTADQFKKAVRGARRAPKDTKVPKGGLRALRIPGFPGPIGPGSPVVVYPNCGPKCVALPRYTKDKNGNAFFMWICDCPRPVFTPACLGPVLNIATIEYECWKGTCEGKCVVRFAKVQRIDWDYWCSCE